MKKGTVRHSAKAHSRKAQGDSEEFGREWQELEDQNQRLKPDWMGLAAQLGFSVADKPY